MTGHRALVLVAFTTVVVGPGCVPKPKQAYTLEQIPQIDDMEEVMRVQAHTIDPWFAKSDQTSFTDAEYQTLARAARTLQATAASLRDRFSKGKTRDFAYHANRQDAGADQLLAAAESKAAAGIRSSLYAIRRACKSCHKQYK
jgi:cytochrome c556